MEALVKKVCDLLQQYTQYGGVRPFGASLLIGGIDDTGPHLFETDPSGLSTGYKADAIGAGRDQAIEILEKEYKEGMNLQEAASLALKALKAGLEQGQSLGTISAGYINQGEKFKIMSQEELKRLFNI